jgi:hypothetical protein
MENTKKNVKDPWTASMIINLIYLCDKVSTLNEFDVDVQKLFKEDVNHQLYTSFEKDVIDEHFQTKLAMLLDPKKTETT